MVWNKFSQKWCFIPILLVSDCAKNTQNPSVASTPPKCDFLSCFSGLIFSKAALMPVKFSNCDYSKEIHHTNKLEKSYIICCLCVGCIRRLTFTAVGHQPLASEFKSGLSYARMVVFFTFTSYHWRLSGPFSMFSLSFSNLHVVSFVVTRYCTKCHYYLS